MVLMSQRHPLVYREVTYEDAQRILDAANPQRWEPVDGSYPPDDMDIDEFYAKEEDSRDSRLIRAKVQLGKQQQELIARARSMVPRDTGKLRRSIKL